MGGAATAAQGQTDPLPSWNAGPAKQAITSFVAGVTREGGPDFVRPAERIAVFDNDGTLWAEQPMCFQASFVFDRIRQLASGHPQRKEKEPFSSVLKGDARRHWPAGSAAAASSSKKI